MSLPPTRSTNGAHAQMWALCGAVGLLVGSSFAVSGPRLAIDDQLGEAIGYLGFAAGPGAVLWWWLAPAAATRLLPLVAGIFVAPVAIVLLIPDLAASTPAVVRAVLAAAGTVAYIAAGVIALVASAALLRAGRTGVAASGAAAVVLQFVVGPTVTGAVLGAEIPEYVYPAGLLLSAGALLVGGLLRGPGRATGPSVVSSARGCAALVAMVATTAPSVWLRIEPRSLLAGSGTGFLWTFGTLSLVLAVVGASLLGSRAMVLVLGLGLAVGSLRVLAAFIGPGVRDQLWLVVVVVLTTMAGTALAILRQARAVGLVATALTAAVVLIVFLLDTFGDLDSDAALSLTVLGVVVGVVAGGALSGAAVRRVGAGVDVVPVILLALPLGLSVSSLGGAALRSEQSAVVDAFPWIAALLVLAAVVVGRWGRPAMCVDGSDSDRRPAPVPDSGPRWNEAGPALPTGPAGRTSLPLGEHRDSRDAPG